MPTPTTAAPATSSLPRLANEPAVGSQFHATWTNYTAQDRAVILHQSRAWSDAGSRGFELRLVAGGWRLLEVPLNSPDPLVSISSLAKAHPEALVGAGTVLTARQVHEVHDAGGQLIVAPNFNAEVVRQAVALGMVCLPGVFTATEAFAALDAGAAGLKLFPAEMIPPAAVKALRAVLPSQTLLLPVGGITTANMAAYRAAGASGFRSLRSGSLALERFEAGPAGRRGVPPAPGG